jgi:hypothetical protein
MRAHSTVDARVLFGIETFCLCRKEASYVADTNWRWGLQLITWIKCDEVVLRQKFICLKALDHLACSLDTSIYDRDTLIPIAL